MLKDPPLLWFRYVWKAFLLAFFEALFRRNRDPRAWYLLVTKTDDEGDD